MRHRTQFTVAVVVVSLAMMIGAKPVGASPVNPIGPYSGNLSETWEGFSPSLPYLSGPASIMGGAASISTTSDMFIYQTVPPPSVFTLGGSGSAQSIGQRGMGIDDTFPLTSVTTITFAAPTTIFGAYWAAITDGSNNPSSVTVSFFDASNFLLDTEIFNYNNNGTLDWHGWSAAPTESFKSITYTGSGVVIDSLQAAAESPEPATWMMFGIGLAWLAGYACLVRRRR